MKHWAEYMHKAQKRRLKAHSPEIKWEEGKGSRAKVSEGVKHSEGAGPFVQQYKDIESL
jgi:hypothetical protein